MAFASPIYGWSVKKYRPKNTALMGCFVGCFAFTLASKCPFYNTLPGLLILYLGIGGFGCGAVIYTGNIGVATYFNKRRYEKFRRHLSPEYICVKYFLSFPQKNLSPEKSETN